MASKTPNVKRWEDILDIRDLRSASLLLREWKVDAKGIKNLEDAKDRLVKHWNEHVKPIELTPEQKSSGFESAIRDHKRVRDKLLDMCRSTEKFYSGISPQVKGSLEQTFQDIPTSFKERNESLRTGECTIVIAGEVGAGKSTLVNLLLGVQLFPTNQLKCTNVICEIRHSDTGRKEAFAYYKMELSESGDRIRKVPPKIISLADLKGIQEFKDCIMESNEYDDNPYDRVEVYWPFQMLSKGVVIIDTPGIEGGNNVDNSLQKYLSKAFGFIYVINTTTAGGVQHGRLGHLLNMVVNSTDEFSPEASLFIGNKWEFVPDEDKEDVKNDIFTKLSKVYPGIMHNQIQYMSIKKAHEVSIKYKTQIGDHTELLRKVQKLIPNSLRQGMTSNYWWLSSFLKRASYLLRVTNIQHAMTREELEKQCIGLKEKVDVLQKNTDENLKSLRKKLDFEIYQIGQKIKDILNSRKMLDILCNWDDSNNCAKPSRRWKCTADEAAMKIADRLGRLVDGWEREHQILKRIDNDIVNVFSSQLGLMESQIKELEDALLKNRGGQSQFCHTVKIVPVKALFAKKNKKIERTYTTLGGAISCAGMLDTNKREVRNIFRDYNDKTKSQKMGEATVVFVETILGHKDLQAKLSKFFKRFSNDIDEAEKRIPSFLKADQQLIDTIIMKKKDVERDSVQFPQLADNCSELLGKLDIFYVNNIMKFDYEIDEIDWDSSRPPLGTGSFADVYEAKIPRKQNRAVALKVSKESVRMGNITDILMEDRTMRDLKHPNVVRYFGATYRRKKHDDNIQWIMILEMCSCTLRDVYIAGDRRESKAPARCQSDDPNKRAVTHKMINHAREIFLGLEYIHRKGYTHRDMKMENVLVAFDGSIKVTDVGVAKETSMLMRTCNGSPAYMAPEVLLGTRNHSDKVDIYSTAFIIWEMWFGKEVTTDMNHEVLGYDFRGDAMSALKERQSRADGGFRPSFSLPNRPPDNMVQLIKKGWSQDPNDRPPAQYFVKFFDDFLRNN